MGTYSDTISCYEQCDSSCREVLRSPPMIQLQRCLRRTYYYIDHKDADGRVTRVISTSKSRFWNFTWRAYSFLVSLRRRVSNDIICLVSHGETGTDYIRSETWRILTLLQHASAFNWRQWAVVVHQTHSLRWSRGSLPKDRMFVVFNPSLLHDRLFPFRRRFSIALESNHRRHRSLLSNSKWSTIVTIGQ